MVICYSRKFIFVHIDKTAGTSVKNVLSKYCWYPHESVFTTILKKLNLRLYSEEFYDHIRAVELKKYIPSKTYNSFFKFAFVRNPWDWMLSSYTYFNKNKDMHPHVYYKYSIKSFKDFIKWQVGNPYAYHTQKEFLVDHNNNLIVDFIGKFEQIDEDFEKICSKIGILEKLPKLNVSKKHGYVDQYDNETKDLVAKYYKEDISLFNYEF